MSRGRRHLGPDQHGRVVRGEGRRALGLGGSRRQPDGQMDASVDDQECRDHPDHDRSRPSRETLRTGTAMRTTDSARATAASESRDEARQSEARRGDMAVILEVVRTPAAMCSAC